MKVTAAELRAEYEGKKTVLNGIAEGDESRIRLSKVVNRLKKAFEAEEDKVADAQEAWDFDKMVVQEAKVGAGEEDAGDAVEKIEGEKAEMAQEKLKAQKEKVNSLHGEQNEALAKRTAAMADEEKMEEIEKKTKSPAVKSAAEAMESKENDAALDDMEKAVAAKKAAKEQEIRLKDEQDADMKDGAATSDAAKAAKLEAKKAKEATKQIMDFEGKKFAKAMKQSAEAQINAAKVNLMWNRLKKQADQTSSASHRKELESQVTGLKMHEKEELHKVLSFKKIAETTTLHQHQVAQELDKTLAAAVAKTIQGDEPEMTEAEQTAQEDLDIMSAESGTEADEMDYAKEDMARLSKKLSELQDERNKDEEDVRLKQDQMKAVKKDPLPEVSQGVQQEDAKEVKSIERAKEQEMSQDIEDAKEDAKQVAKGEVKLALELEHQKQKFRYKKRKAKMMIDKQTEAEDAVRLADGRAKKQKYGEESVLKKSEQESVQSGVKMKQAQAQQKMEEAADASFGTEAETQEQQQELSLDKKITNEKSAVSDIQSKLKSLKAKIGGSAITSAEGSS